MRNYTVSYRLTRDGSTIDFQSEKDACAFLGVSKCSVASCYRRNRKCKGYDVERGCITTHNETKTRLFRIWGGMKERCYRGKHPQYKNYGERGIEICDEWKNDFCAFREWANKNGYNDELTIERIDVNGNYEPANCTWIPLADQEKNKRTNHYVVVDGERMILSDCSKKYKIPKSTLRWRERNGRDIITGAKMRAEPPKEDRNEFE